MPTKNSITTARIGDKFERLEVIGYAERNSRKQLPRVCRCICGAIVTAFAGHLTHGHTRSCGCLEREVNEARNRERSRQAKRRGGFSLGHPRTYDSWRNMVYRCENEKGRDYHRYGGRGIMICSRWRASYAEFLADLGPRPLRKTLDRIDVNGHYSCGACEQCRENGWKANCRWATAKTQCNNRRRHRRVTFRGRTRTLAEWAREVGIDAGTIARRLRYNWNVERALTTPVE